MNDLQKTLEAVQKLLSTPTYIEGPILIRENLSGVIDRLTNKETPLRDLFARKTGSGEAASWNILTAIGVGNSAFAEGGTPTEDNATYDRRSAIYKELGKKKSITDRMLAAGRSFVEQEGEQTEVAIREVIQDEEQFIVTGDATGTPTEFDGLDNLITTNLTNDNNNALGFRTLILETEVATLLNTYGVRATQIVTSYGMKKAINESLAGDVRVNLDQSNQIGTGVDVTFFQSMIGKLPFIATFAIADDSATFPSFIVSDIYVLTQNTKGQDVLYMEDLYTMGKTMLDRTGAAINFMVTEATVLVCRAEEMQAIVQNVRIA